jgi:hypothetical protein
MAINLSEAQQYFVDLIRSHLSMRDANAQGSSYKLSATLGDEEIWEDFRLGLNYFNTLPPRLTSYCSEDLYSISKSTAEQGGDAKAPEREDLSSILITPIMMCALFYSGLRLQWFEAGKHFRYNDNGINIERAKQQDYANIVNGDILAYLNNQLMLIKKTLAFTLVKPVGLWSGMISMPRSLSRALRGCRSAFGG